MSSPKQAVKLVLIASDSKAGRNANHKEASINKAPAVKRTYKRLVFTLKSGKVVMSFQHDGGCD